MSQKLSSKFPQTKTSGSRQGKPSSKRQKVSNGAVPSIPTPAKTSSVQPVQLYGEEEAQCLKQFDLTSRFGKQQYHYLDAHGPQASHAKSNSLKARSNVRRLVRTCHEDGAAKKVNIAACEALYSKVTPLKPACPCLSFCMPISGIKLRAHRGDTGVNMFRHLVSWETSKKCQTVLVRRPMHWNVSH